MKVLHKSNLLILSLFVMLLHHASWGQELNCSVQIQSPQLSDVEKRLFETLKTSITEFLNNTRWTNDIYRNDERIECSVVIIVSEKLSVDEFKGTIQVQSRRPVFKTSYNTLMLNFLDQDFNFKYTEFQPLEFNENAYIANLTSVLAYYAYVIIGLDYDSFSPEGGPPYYQKAQQVVNNAQGAGERGWRAFESQRNRYWLAENLANPNFKNLRLCLYQYHRLGLDVMSTDLEKGRTACFDALDLLNKVHQISPLSFLMQQFFVAKSDEVVNMFSNAPPDQKAKLVPTLTRVDPANNVKYIKISGN
jgi:hypothetical protein